MISDFERSLRATLGVEEPLTTYWVTVPDVSQQTKQLRNPVTAADPRAAALAAKRQLQGLGEEHEFYYNVYAEDPRQAAHTALWTCDEDSRGFVECFGLHGKTAEDDA